MERIVKLWYLNLSWSWQSTPVSFVRFMGTFITTLPPTMLVRKKAAVQLLTLSLLSRTLFTYWMRLDLSFTLFLLSHTFLTISLSLAIVFVRRGHLSRFFSLSPFLPLYLFSLFLSIALFFNPDIGLLKYYVCAERRHLNYTVTWWQFKLQYFYLSGTVA